jgi:hypothetical protein
LAPKSATGVAEAGTVVAVCVPLQALAGEAAVQV